MIVSQFMGKTQNKLVNVRGQARLVKGHTSRRYRIYYDLHITNKSLTVMTP